MDDGRTAASPYFAVSTVKRIKCTYFIYGINMCIKVILLLN